MSSLLYAPTVVLCVAYMWHANDILGNIHFYLTDNKLFSVPYSGYIIYILAVTRRHAAVGDVTRERYTHDISTINGPHNIYSINPFVSCTRMRFRSFHAVPSYIYYTVSRFACKTFCLNVYNTTTLYRSNLLCPCIIIYSDC